MRTWYDQETSSHRFLLGQGSMRLWMKEAHAARNISGDYLDSLEPFDNDPLSPGPSGIEQVWYSYGALGIDPATGGELILYVEHVRPTATTAAARIKVHHKLEKTYSSGANIGQVDPKHSLTRVEVLPVTAEKIEVKWVARNTATDVTNLDANPHLNKGARILPDLDSPNDTLIHDLIDVQVQIWPAPPAGTTVYFRAFDVDDPNVDADMKLDPGDDPEEDGTRLPIGGDNRGETPGNRGSFVLPGGAINYGTSATTDAAGRATVAFQVTMQPGDNFRIAASLSNAELDTLTTFAEGESGMFYVSATNKQVANEDVALTDMLTVWRRLWIERDAMAGVVANRLSRSVIQIIEDGFEHATELYDVVQIPPTEAGAWEGGYIELPDQNRRIPILMNSPTEIIVPRDSFFAGDIDFYNQADPNRPVILEDDDVLPTGGTHALVSGGDLLLSAFGQAYIEPRYVDPDPNGWNSSGTVPFVRWLGDNLDVVEGSRDLFSQADFWTVLVLSAHENYPQTDYDGDGIPGPSGEGAIPLPRVDDTIDLGYAGDGLADDNLVAVFSEALREFKEAFADAEAHTIVHEVGHTAGGGIGHHDYGILKGSPIEYVNETSFSNEVQAIFRDVDTW